MDERWGIERALKSERELGALDERLKASERNFMQLSRADMDINTKLDRGLSDVNARLARFEQTLDENRRRDEAASHAREKDEHRRQDQLIAELRAQAEEGKRAIKNATDRSRPFIAFIIGAGLMLQWLFENRVWELLR